MKQTDIRDAAAELDAMREENIRLRRDLRAAVAIIEAAEDGCIKECWQAYSDLSIAIEAAICEMSNQEAGNVQE